MNITDNTNVTEQSLNLEPLYNYAGNLHESWEADENYEGYQQCQN